MAEKHFTGSVLAGFGRRVGAGVVDYGWFPVIIAVIAVASFASNLNSPDFVTTDTYAVSPNGDFFGTTTTTSALNGVSHLLLVLSVLVWPIWIIANVLVLQGLTGRSLGKRLFGLRLVRADTGAVPSFLVNVARYFAHFLDGVVLNIGYLLPLFTEKKQTIADMVCNTVVVRYQGEDRTETSWR